MRIVVVAVGRLRPPFADDVQHYQKLIAGHARLELIEVREDEAVARRVPERSFVSLLTKEGEAFDSMGFSRFIEDRRQRGLDVCFVIGGPTGIDANSLGRPIDHHFSLGAMTLPFSLARVVLLEQLYRAHKILAGEPYHY